MTSDQPRDGVLQRDDPGPRKETGLVDRARLAAVGLSVAGVASRST